MLRSTTASRALAQEEEWGLFESQAGRLQLPSERQNEENPLLATHDGSTFGAGKPRLFKA
jgi:hypothetical protein